MAEIHGEVFIHVESEAKRDLLRQLFSVPGTCDDWAQKFIGISAALNAEKGKALAEAFLETPEFDADYNLCVENVEERDAVLAVNHTFGSEGDEAIGEVVSFVHQLCPDAMVRGWGCGDDDPWEFWFKPENGEIVREDDSPFEDEDMDREIFDTIYRWWNESVPGSIKPGLLYSELAGHRVVITGSMASGTREEMEERAEEAGAEVQKSVSKTTTLLVVGAKPGASKLEKAKKLFTRTASESEFHEMLGDSGDITLGSAKSITENENSMFLKSSLTEEIRTVLEASGGDVNAICRSTTRNSLFGIDLAQLFEIITAAEEEALRYSSGNLSIDFVSGEDAVVVIDGTDTDRAPLAIDFDGIVAHFAQLGITPEHRRSGEDEAWEWSWFGSGFVASIRLMRAESGYECSSIEMQFKRGDVPQGKVSDIAIKYAFEPGRFTAAEWFDIHERCLQESEQGSVEAMFALSLMYRVGRGCNANVEESTEWLMKAADKGHAFSQYRLGEDLYDGIRGVTRDQERGLHYLKLAVGQEQAQAQRKLKAIEGE